MARRSFLFHEHGNSRHHANRCRNSHASYCCLLELLALLLLFGLNRSEVQFLGDSRIGLAP
jgi:hypothetical protein